jgi:hypothetical protein
MKKTKILVSAIVVIAFAFLASPVALSGNGAPNGAHYNLNIIGVKNAKKTDMDGSNGHVIFVNLDGKSKIGLVEGDDYAVLDANGTDGDGALLQLPDPGLDPYVVGDKGDADTESEYSVFVRPLGKPGGYATITTCAEVVESNLATFLGAKDAKALNRAGEFGGQCSIEQVGSEITMRTKGKSYFTNVTAQLLTMVLKVEVDEDGDDIVDYTVYVRVPIFDPILEGEYWEYDNHDLKLLQVRFYPVGTDVSEADDPEAWDEIEL